FPAGRRKNQLHAAGIARSKRLSGVDLKLSELRACLTNQTQGLLHRERSMGTSSWVFTGLNTCSRCHSCGYLDA
ncbi:unnamed protein product, partial [Nesidiocoris tenuis]